MNHLSVEEKQIHEEKRQILWSYALYSATKALFKSLKVVTMYFRLVENLSSYTASKRKVQTATCISYLDG